MQVSDNGTAKESPSNVKIMSCMEAACKGRQQGVLQLASTKVEKCNFNYSFLSFALFISHKLNKKENVI
jgi:hypothetical protein